MRLITLTLTLLLVCGAVTALAAPAEDLSLEIKFGKDFCRLIVEAAGELSMIEFDPDDITRTDRQILVDGELLADELGFHVGQYIVLYEDLELRRVSAPREVYSILLEPIIEREGARRRRSSDQLVAFESVRVERPDFVRGDVFVVGADILVEGEVNGNVVALFGDVRLSHSSICRKDVLAVGGRVEKHSDAGVYGEIQSTGDWRRHKNDGRDDEYNDRNIVDLHGAGQYNRVDGVMLEAGLTFRSEEEFMPEFFVDYGYGFWSKRSKYRLGLKHQLFDYNQLSFGGQVYRQTKTEDEWRCGSGENTIYALLAREDFRDYYEGEGGSIFIEQSLTYDHTFRVDYTIESLDYLPANPNLWSLFGGDKKFRSNFSSLTDSLRDAHLPDYEQDEAVLKLSYIFDTSADRFGDLMRKGWYAAVVYEHSSEGLGSDFDYDRLLLELRRYQPLTYRQNLNLRLLYGSATGNLPLHKFYYLGGIRTLRAFDIKEFYGSRMAMANLEYVLDFPRTDIGIAILLDIGKTGWCSDFLSEGDWLADVGVGFSVGDLRAELTRPINGDTDKIQFSILMGRSF